MIDWNVFGATAANESASCQEDAGGIKSKMVILKLDINIPGIRMQAVQSEWHFLLVRNVTIWMLCMR